MRSSNHIHCIKTVWKMLIESARITTKMLLYTLLLSFYVTSPVLGLMKVSTYNLWNIMFNWDVRKYRIARMVSRLFFLSYLLTQILHPGNLLIFSSCILSNVKQCLWFMHHYAADRAYVMFALNNNFCKLQILFGFYTQNFRKIILLLYHVYWPNWIDEPYLRANSVEKISTNEILLAI